MSVGGDRLHILLNGKPVDTRACSLFQLLEEQSFSGEVVILNGFQTSEDHPITEGDSVTVIQKGVMPDKEALESMMAARHTPKVHACVKQATVGIAGLGGLGSNIAVMLARTGVGRLILADFDQVEPSNLNRQNYEIAHLGMYKADALKEQIGRINPYITVESHPIRVTAENIRTLFGTCQVICEAFDDPDAKAMLVDTALASLPDVKVVAASGMAGYASANQIRTRRFGRLYLCGDNTSEAMPGNGLMAPRVQVCAGHQANMVLRLLLGCQDP